MLVKQSTHFFSVWSKCQHIEIEKKSDRHFFSKVSAHWPVDYFPCLCIEYNNLGSTKNITISMITHNYLTSKKKFFFTAFSTHETFTKFSEVVQLCKIHFLFRTIFCKSNDFDAVYGIFFKNFLMHSTKMVGYTKNFLYKTCETCSTL